MTIVESVTDVVGNLLDIADTILFDTLAPFGQSLIPGSGNSIWNTSMYVWMILLTFLFITKVYIDRWMK